MPINTMAILADGIRSVRARGGDLRIVGLRGSMKRLFDFFVFTGMIDIYPNEKQAVRSFGLRKEAA
jgi:anti-anti-sigma regulatory factor